MPAPGETLKVTLVTNIPTPYRTAWFDALGEEIGQGFQVLYLGSAHPERRNWTVPQPSHTSVMLSNRVHEFRGYAFHPVFGKVWKALEARMPDAVIVGGWDQLAFWIARLWCLRRRKCYVPSIESHRNSGRRRGRLSTSFRRRFISGAAAVMAVSEETARFVRDLGYGGVVRIVSNPASPPPDDEGTTHSSSVAERGARSLGFLGEFSERKNPAQVIRVAAAQAVLNERVSVRLAGGGLLEALLIQLSEQLDVDVEVSGFVEGEDLEAFWTQISVLVLPSLADPAPLVLSEAAIRGVPFVASDRCGSASTLVSRGAVGRVVALEAGVDIWAHAVQSMLVCSRACCLEAHPRHASRQVRLLLEEVIGR